MRLVVSSAASTVRVKASEQRGILSMVYNRRDARSKRPVMGRPPKPFKCKHFWQYEEPDGETVIGTCLKCGDTQEVVSFWEASERIPTTEELEWSAMTSEEQRQYCTPVGEWKGMAST